jgi:uncharacterized membrane protein
MRQFTISAAAATVFAALLASAPAQAENLGGASAKNGNQCFSYSVGQQRDGRFGYWGSCPQTASATVAPAPRQVRRHRAASR